MGRFCVIAALLVGCSADDHHGLPTFEHTNDAGAPADDFVNVVWPPDEPLPPELDFPPWLTMPEPGRIVVSWRTTEPRGGAVRFWSDDGDGAFMLSPAVEYLHHVDLGVLNPGTAYQYEVYLDDTNIVRRGAFVTPGASRWRFIHVAEFHAPTNSDDVAKFTSTIRGFRPNVLVESGDMTDTGTNLDHWRSYLRTSAPWISNVILLPAHSNHANGFQGNENILDLFELPNNERWYRTRYGQVAFVSLDSTYNGDNPDIAAGQIDWLARSLYEARNGFDDPLLTIASWHYPACSSHYAGRASSREWVMDNFVDTLVNDVDLILVGHDKYYERSVIDGQILHLMTNAGKLAPSTEGGNHARCTPLVTDIETRSLGLFEVDGTHMTAWVVDETGVTLDTFEIQKDLLDGGPQSSI